MNDDTNAGRELLVRIASDLGLDREIARTVPDPVHPVPLPSRLAVGALAWASVTAASLASGREDSHLHSPDPDRIAMAYRSDRILLVDGRAPTVWSPYSGFWAASDGWVRTHGNYPHHARAFRSALEVSAKADPDEIRALFAGSTVHTCVERITRAGGLAVAVKAEDRARDAALRDQPLVDVRRIDEAAPRTREVRPNVTTPLDGIRVLDLTRVIAGPVCTRTLALLGADVLRIDPPHLPEIDWQHLDTGHGKRSALLDATSTQMTDLLEAADVIVLGYRPAALARLGLSPAHLARRHPGLVIAQLSAWGVDQPDRAGFDSLVQAESGIALIESPDGGRPGALPAQALDHSAGYLLAASVCRAITRQAQEGGTWHVSTSLRRIAAELLGMPRLQDPEPEREVDVADHSQQFDVSGQAVTTARAALPGFTFAPPRTWAGDAPSW
ncbi:carnitine dehydratase [Microbacterium sp. CH12i]|uniref:CoA transferase n=1 Tax=Microbacterium sp. CH12i TaxID=1479651 RepID=UPI000461D019|nr:CoA transferase [Microbacterium sp. CH12i]KDA06101.1 carnitine dehydratase [Microbacterium sp. CH12i]